MSGNWVPRNSGAIASICATASPFRPSNALAERDLADPLTVDELGGGVWDPHGDQQIRGGIENGLEMVTNSLVGRGAHSRTARSGMFANRPWQAP